jgi:predicted MPP superfamily phosphohydrolase
MRRAAAAAAILVIASGILVSAHLYVADRLVYDPGLDGFAGGLLLWVIASLGFSMVLEPLTERFYRPPTLRCLSWIPLLWMGVLWLTVVTLGISDGLLWLLGAAPAEGAARIRALAVVGVVAAATVAGLRAALAKPRVRRVEVRIERWPESRDGFRIVQLSDLHIGPILGRAFAAGLVAEVKRLAPDLIVLTGDLVDGSVNHIRDEVEPLARLSAPHGCYFVTGNHDYYSGAEAWVERVRELGMRPLRNERVQIGAGDQAFDLAGVEDHRGDWIRGSPEDLAEALRGRDPDRPVVLLAHDPTSFGRAQTMQVDLQLSGHTHGGQIWPFVYLVRLAVPYAAGLLRRGRSQLYVSRGTGFWGPPIRLFAPSEITEIVIRRASQRSDAV